MSLCGVCASCHFIVHNACWHSLQTSLQIVPSSHTLVKSYTMMHARGTCLCLWLSLACRACDIKGMCVKAHRMEAVFMSVATTPGWMATKVKPSSGVTSDAQLSVTAVTWTIKTATKGNLPVVSQQMPSSASLQQHSNGSWTIYSACTFSQVLRDLWCTVDDVTSNLRSAWWRQLQASCHMCVICIASATAGQDWWQCKGMRRSNAWSGC